MDVAWPELVPQKITSWGSWPDDVIDILKTWNRARRLTFCSAPRHSINGVRYFICADCQRFIRSLDYIDARLDGRFLCEDCLIEAARA